MQRRAFPGIKAVFLCAAIAASAAFAGVPWFDAGIAGMDYWPSDGTGAHFVALEFGGDVTDQVQWRPSFMPPPYDSAGYGAVVAAAEEEGVRRWLDGLAATEEGQRAITNFAGTADALVKCYLVDQAPESEPDIEVEIPSIAFDAEGRPVVGGKLMLHGAESERTVNGMIRLYHAPSLQQLDQSGEYLDLGREFPVPSAPREVPNTPSRFFRLWIGK